MAEGVLFDIASEILKDLGSIVVKKLGSIWGVSEEIKRLEATISSIKAVLRDAEKKRTNSDQVRDLVDNLEDVVYDADDLVDKLRSRASQQNNDNIARTVSNFFFPLNQFAFRLKLAHELKEIRKKLDQTKEHRAFNLLEDNFVSTKFKTRETHSFVPQEEVIGRDHDKKSIIQHLLYDGFEENVCIIPIVGLGGLGKTTLAQFVFNDVMVKKYFELKAWVCVSDQFDLKEVVQKITKSFKAKCDENPGVDELQNILRREIDGKKYLLVLDDLWLEDRKEWFELKKLLMGGARGSKVLVTTRSEVVARVTKTEGISPYRLEGLDIENSLSLFARMAFDQETELQHSQTIKVIGKEIVEKCRGVPLAIKTIGSLLYTKNTEAEWLAFRNMELMKINQRDNDILPTLLLSYNHLPSHLKQCFAYCRLFSKDYVFYVPLLIQLWMAQGFIESTDPQLSLEDIGYGYFMELLGRSFFQEAERESFGFISTCRMHDLMHDLAISVAGNGSASLSTRLETCGKLRHVSFDFGSNMSWKIPEALLQWRKVRTFIQQDPARTSNARNTGSITFYPKIRMRSSNCLAIIHNLKSLRALDLCWMHLNKLPDSLGELIHLRYLDLRGNNMVKLPSSITKLHNLQTLVLFGCYDLLTLPKDINRLVNLRHLDMSECYSLTYLPKGIGELTALRTLNRFVVMNKSNSLPRGKGGLNELNGLNNLRGSLEILLFGHGRAAASTCKTATLGENLLQNLSVRWQKNGYENEGDITKNDEMLLDILRPNSDLKTFELWHYMGTKVPEWVPMLAGMTKLELFSCRNLRHISSLDPLTSLEEIRLEDLSSLEFISTSVQTFSSTILPSLRSLRIIGCPELKGWWRIEGDGNIRETESITEQHQPRTRLPFFPCLSTLFIRYCPNLSSLPLFPNVKRLDLMDISMQPLMETIEMMLIEVTRASPMAEFSSFSSNPYLSTLKFQKMSDVNRIWLMWTGSLPLLQCLELGSHS